VPAQVGLSDERIARIIVRQVLERLT
jgi:hypothetical protein